MRSRAASAFLVLAAWATIGSGTARSDDPPQDPPANFLIDISATAGGTTALVFATDGKFWQVSNNHARRGCGMAFYVQDDPGNSRTSGAVHFEVEPLGSRAHAQAVADWETALPVMLGKDNYELVGKVNRSSSVQPLVIGKTRVPGLRFDYAFVAKGTDNKDTHHAWCVGLVLGKAFIVVSTEKFGVRQSWFDQVMKSISVVQPPATPPDCRTLKLVDMQRAPMQYTVATIPERWTQDCSLASSGVHSAWVRRDAKTQRVAGRLSIDALRLDGTFDLLHWLGDKRADYDQRFHDVSDPVETKAGTLSAYALNYVDRSDDRGQVFRVRRVFVRIGDAIWMWTVASDTSDEPAVVEDGRRFDELLTGVRAWTGSWK